MDSEKFFVSLIYVQKFTLLFRCCFFLEKRLRHFVKFEFKTETSRNLREIKYPTIEYTNRGRHVK